MFTRYHAAYTVLRLTVRAGSPRFTVAIPFFPVCVYGIFYGSCTLFMSSIRPAGYRLFHSHCMRTGD